MGKRMCIWLTDIEYKALEEVLKKYCSEKGYSLNQAIRDALFKGLKKIKKEIEEEEELS